LNFLSLKLSGVKRLRWLCGLSFFLGVTCLSQPVWAQRKVHRGGAFWPELQAEYVLKSTSYFYLRNHYRHNWDNDFNYLRPEGFLKYLERAQIRAGYEHVFNAHWSGGISESYAFEGTRNLWFNEVFARHIGAIGRFRLTKRAYLEHNVQTNQDDRARFRFRTDLERDFKIRKKAIRPRIGYELFFNHYYDAGINEARNTRQVDRSRLRLELTYSIDKHLAFTPYLMRQTDFITTLASFDVNGNELQPGGKQNTITPVFGIDIRYVFYQGGTPFSRVIRSNK